MAKRLKHKYGDYAIRIGGELYAAAWIRQPDGTRRRITKKVANKSEARQWALEQIEGHSAAARIDPSVTFADLARWYSANFLLPPKIENGIRVAGVRDFERLRNKLARITLFFGDRPMREFTEADLLRWRSYRGRTVSQATLNRDLAFIRTMLRRAVKYRKIPRMPGVELNLAAEVARDRVVSIEEERAMLAACVDEETVRARSRAGNEYARTNQVNRAYLRAVIICAADTAMRKNEIFTLTWADVDLEAGVIAVRASNTKTQRSRIVGMTPRLRSELQWLEQADPAAKVFRSPHINRAFRTVCKRANCPDVVFHDLRHTAITRLIRAGVPHTEVMKISGHTTIKTFLRYLNLQPDAARSASERLAAFLEEN